MLQTLAWRLSYHSARLQDSLVLLSAFSRCSSHQITALQGAASAVKSSCSSHRDSKEPPSSTCWPCFLISMAARPLKPQADNNRGYVCFSVPLVYWEFMAWYNNANCKASFLISKVWIAPCSYLHSGEENPETFSVEICWQLGENSKCPQMEKMLTLCQETPSQKK